MEDRELQQFLLNSDKETIKYYLDGIKNKLADLNSRNDRVLLLMLLIVVSYYLIENSMLSALNLVFVELHRFDYGLIIIPLVFSFLYLYYLVQFFHSTEIRKISKLISNHLFKNESSQIDPDSFAGELINNFLPYSFWDDQTKILSKSPKDGCFAALFALPLFGIYFTPFIFQYYSLKRMLHEQWNNGFWMRIIILLTMWIIGYTIYFIIKFFVYQYKKNSRSKTEHLANTSNPT